MQFHKYLFQILLLFITCLSFLTTTSAQEYLEFLDSEDMTFEEIVIQAELIFDEKGRGKHTGYKQFMRWKYFAQRNLDDQGYVISDRETTKRYDAFLGGSPIKNNNKSVVNPWIEKGPLSATNTSTWSSHIGRVTNIAIDPMNSNHILITSPGGGAWKTVDEGVSWLPIYDFESSMNLYSAMISHTNPLHYFVGGSGIRRSLDGGATWTSTSGTGGTIYSILMHPTNSNIILACSSNGKIFRSTDGGANWLTSIDHTTNLYDLEFMPGNPNVVFASGRTGSFFISSDNGITWTSQAGPWAARSLMMAVTPIDPQYLYVLQESSGGFGALYLSINGGATFTLQSDDSSNANNIMGYNLTAKGGQAPRDMDIIVSPIDKTEVHVAGVMTFKSTDSGVNWAQTTNWIVNSTLPFVHADIDQLVYSGNKIYVASDGGFFLSTDQAATFTDRTTGLGLRQFYRIGASTSEVGRVSGGSQDNGTGILKSGAWYDYIGADGMETMILNQDENLVFGSIQYGGLYRSTNGGQTVSGISEATSGNAEWVTPLEKDPTLSNTIYQGRRHLYKSTSNGDGWVAVSNIIPSGNTNIDEVCLAPSDNQTIYISYSSELYRTVDGGLSWIDVTPSITGHGSVNYINIDPDNKNHVIIAVSGSARFIESNDGGVSWSNIRYNLPNIGANSVVFDQTTDNGIYVAMSKGVYFKDDNTTTTWTLVDLDLPNVNITELEIIGTSLYAATYGRGLWEMDIAGASCTLTPNISFVDCFSQGTQDSLDDAYTFSIDPNGLNLGTNYTVTGDVSAANVPYGSPYLFDNGGLGFLESDGALSVTITDDSDGTCPKTFTVLSSLIDNCLNNHICEDAFIIPTAGIYSALGPNAGNGATNSNRNANWYIFTPSYNGLLSVESCNYGEDTNLYLYAGTCTNKTLIASSDDNCTMGPGLNAYASQVTNVQVYGGIPILIEWDSRWSSNPFKFLVEFEEECIDYVIADVTAMNDQSLRADTEIKLQGILSDTISTFTPGELMVSDQFTVGLNGVIVANSDVCALNSNLDWLMIGGSGTVIDNIAPVEILFDVPTNLNNPILDINVVLDIKHTALGELTIQLINPTGQIVNLWSNICAGEVDMNFILDEEGLDQNSCVDTWKTGRNQLRTGAVPATSLSTFYGNSAVGTWKIKISDNVASNSGVINVVGLHFRS